MNFFQHKGRSPFLTLRSVGEDIKLCCCLRVSFVKLTKNRDFHFHVGKKDPTHIIFRSHCVLRECVRKCEKEQQLQNFFSLASLVKMRSKLLEVI